MPAPSRASRWPGRRCRLDPAHGPPQGYANCVKFTIPWMRKVGRGSVVMMASVSSHIAQPAFVPYNT